MPLTGKKIAVPETRQLDVLVRLLEKKNADVLRCPLIAIHDSPNEEGVLAWLKEFVANPPDDFIILTGEGIRRLRAVAEKHGILEDWTAALAKTNKIARGPKPGKALREMGLRTDKLAEKPTTDGVISTLSKMQLAGHTVAVQLYGEDPNKKLMDYLAERDIEPNCVAPYVYASASEDDAVASLIKSMAGGDIDMICFTSQPQLKRLQTVARKEQLESVLALGMTQTKLAAVGPIIGDLLTSQGYRVAVQPDDSFFMGDLVKAIVDSVT